MVASLQNSPGDSHLKVFMYRDNPLPLNVVWT